MAAIDHDHGAYTEHSVSAPNAGQGIAVSGEIARYRMEKLGLEGTRHIRRR